MDIILFSGQSNMQGQTESCPPRDIVPNAYEYRYLTNEIRPLCHPVGEDIDGGLLLGAHEGHGSLIPDLCRTYGDMTDREVLAVHVARGSTTVADWQPETDRYATLVTKVRGAIEAAADAFGEENIDSIYFLWLQGESDAIYGVSEADYKTSLLCLRDALAEDLPIDAFCLIRVGKFVGDARDLEILRAQEALAAEDQFVLLTRATGICTQDARYLNPHVAGHFGNAGMTLIGESAGRNLARLTLGEPLLLEDEPYTDMRA